MIYLHKILSALVSPLFVILVLLLLSLIYQRRRFIVIAFFLLWVASTPIISQTLTSFLERNHKYISYAEVSAADATVVLSGMVVPIRFDDSIIYEWNGSSDRIFAGIKLILEKKSPKLILTRGQLPWVKGQPEGEILAEFAQGMGVSSSQIFLTNVASNTEEEAAAVANLLKPHEKKIILVTSAFHMPRAIQLFTAEDLEVIPYPVDFKREETLLSVLDFIPHASAFSKTSFAVRELTGRLYYSLKYRFSR